MLLQVVRELHARVNHSCLICRGIPPFHQTTVLGQKKLARSALYSGPLSTLHLYPSSTCAASSMWMNFGKLVVQRGRDSSRSPLL